MTPVTPFSYDVHGSEFRGRPITNPVEVTAQADRFQQAGQVPRAVELLRSALTDKEDLALRKQLGLLYAISGDAVNAEACYRRAISSSPSSGDAWYGIAFLGPGAVSGKDVGAMRAALHSADTADRDRILLDFALARTLDHLERYDEAFDHLLEANRLQRESLDFSIDAQRPLFAEYQTCLGQAFADHCKNGSVDDNTAILIVGMPRSGTTLVEQILASHPDVHGAGEVEYSRILVEEIQKLTGKPFPQRIREIAPAMLGKLGMAYIDKLRSNAGSASRVTDKLPHNFLRIGLFAALMPNTRFIVCDRDPLDTCFSIFQQHMKDGHAYACDLGELGQYYALYEKMISHWCDVYPQQISRVRYERLVTESDARIRNLLDACDLPFDAACLAFHKTERVVDTPSAGQVRKPMYQSSIGRAANYRKQLQPLIAALGL